MRSLFNSGQRLTTPPRGMEAAHMPASAAESCGQPSLHPEKSSAGMEPFAEHHYSVADIAALWNLSPDAVRSVFEKEPGVMVLGGDASTRKKRRYRTLRVPESVVQRVHRRLTNVVGA